MNTHTLQAAKLLQSLIAIPSLSRQEDEAASHLCGFLEEESIAFERIKNNIICRSKHWDDSRPTILLNAHIDTVKPAQGWSRDPFSPTIEDGRLYGLGSNDCGGGLVSLLQAFRILQERPQAYNLIYAVSAEEEVSGKDGFELIRDLLGPISVAIVGEPTSLQPAVAEKGLMVLDITARGRAGHAAREEGENALYKAIDQIQWLRNYRFPKISQMLGETKMTATIIQAGTLHNCIPDSCTYTLDVRTTDCYKNQEILDFLTSQLAAEVKARSTRLNSSSIALSHPIVKRCQALGLKPFGSPTLSDQALMTWPSLKLGPGDSSRSHTADEYIWLDEIKDAIELYVNLLDHLKL